MKQTAQTTWTFVSDDNDQLFFTVEKNEKEIAWPDFSTTEQITTAVTLNVGSKKISLPISLQFMRQLENLCNDMRYTSQIKNATEAQAEAEQARETWLEHVREREARQAALKAAAENPA